MNITQILTALCLALAVTAVLAHVLGYLMYLVASSLERSKRAVRAQKLPRGASLDVISRTPMYVAVSAALRNVGDVLTTALSQDFEFSENGGTSNEKQSSNGSRLLHHFAQVALISVVAAGVGAAMPILGTISPWSNIGLGITACLLQLMWSQRRFGREMRERGEKHTSYWSYNLDDGYEHPQHYDVDEINRRLGIKGRFSEFMRPYSRAFS